MIDKIGDNKLIDSDDYYATDIENILGREITGLEWSMIVNDDDVYNTIDFYTMSKANSRAYIKGELSHMRDDLPDDFDIDSLVDRIVR